MSLQKIPENSVVTTDSNDAALLNPIKLAAQRSFDRRKREEANGGAKSSGADELTAPSLRRTMSLPLSGTYSAALKNARSIMRKLNLPVGPASSSASSKFATSSASGAAPSVSAPPLQRTQSSPVRGSSASRNVRAYSTRSGEYKFRDLLPAKTLRSLHSLEATGKTNVRYAVSAAEASIEDLEAAPESALLNYALQLSVQEAANVHEDDEVAQGAAAPLPTVEQLLHEPGSKTSSSTNVAAISEKLKKEKKAKKKKKKKKGGFSYKNYIKNALTSKATEAEKLQNEKKRIAQNLGGGHFSKFDKL